MFIVGIDIAKHTHQASVMNTDGSLLLLLIIQLNLAILNEFIDNKSPFYDYLLNIDHFLWQGLIGGAIIHRIFLLLDIRFCILGIYYYNKYHS